MNNAYYLLDYIVYHTNQNMNPQPRLIQDMN